MDSVHDNVKEFYGKTIHSHSELKTDVCELGALTNMDKLSVRQAVGAVHQDIQDKYFGCGLCIPSMVEGAKVADLGCGSGRDCFAISKLVGPEGYVLGIDMTDEQLEIAQKYVAYHTEKFGYQKPNVEFRKGYIENLRDAKVEDSQYDILISNCVINLSPDKPAVIKEAHRVLKDGGEFYFSDMYVNNPLPQCIRERRELWGEGLAGALCWRDLVQYAEEYGFTKPRVVSSKRISVEDKKLAEAIGDITYTAVTYRLFKMPKDAPRSPAVATYLGSLSEYEKELRFDRENNFKTDVPVKVEGELAAILRTSRYSKLFKIDGNVEGSTAEEAKKCPVDPYQYISDIFKMNSCKSSPCCS
ncbi:arsenite methyltransferase-like [Diadema antillarum]|uniref:arsenite methyltransferase-like n=1 Tax=Diadema antillarum TaxID=105358 RepID=UPI003A86C0A3